MVFILHFSDKSTGRGSMRKQHLDEEHNYSCQKSFVGKKQVFIENN